MSRFERHLVVMARAPRLGAVKRRLAADIGDLAALRFHRLTTAALLRRLTRDPRWRTWLAVTPDRAAKAGRGLWPTQAGVIPQGGGDLGRRMTRLFERLPPGPVVIVGSDIPDIRATHIAQAFEALGHKDAVLGPADDGGYWLIGLKRRPRLVPPFSGVRWGGGHALEDTERNLKRAGLSVAYLETLKDVDRGEDL